MEALIIVFVLGLSVEDKDNQCFDTSNNIIEGLNKNMKYLKTLFVDHHHSRNRLTNKKNLIIKRKAHQIRKIAEKTSP